MNVFDFSWYLLLLLLFCLLIHIIVWECFCFGLFFFYLSLIDSFVLIDWLIWLNKSMTNDNDFKTFIINIIKVNIDTMCSFKGEMVLWWCCYSIDEAVILKQLLSFLSREILFIHLNKLNNTTHVPPCPYISLCAFLTLASDKKSWHRTG